MLLTSVERVKSSFGVTTNNEDLLLGQLIAASSKRIESYLKRPDAIELKSRTLSISPKLGQRKFYFPAYPVTEIESIQFDQTGRFEGGESEITDYLLTDEGRSVTLVFSPSEHRIVNGISFTTPNSIQITYTGGLAAHGTRSIWAKGETTGDEFTVGNYLKGFTSGAIGRVLSAEETTVSLEIIGGVFEEDETVTEYAAYSSSLDSNGLSDETGSTAVLGERTTASLAELCPDLVEATEMHVRYLRTNRNGFENITTRIDGDTKNSRSDLQRDFFSIPEVRDMLEPYMNYLVNT